MKRCLTVLTAALLLAACSAEEERAAAPGNISASEQEAEEAATVYQAASDFTAPAESGSAPDFEPASQENTEK